jgi:aspartate kinase
MIVMKFGGTSVADAQRIRSVIGIVRDRLDQRPVVVVSAHAGVTDTLMELANRAAVGRPDVSPIRERQLRVAEDLGIDGGVVEPLLSELEALLEGVSLLRDLTPRTLDSVLSFGERMSARVVAAAFAKEGIRAQAVDAFDLGLVTDDNFGGANPLPEADGIIASNLRRLTVLPIVTGYIGKTRGGDVTTLGRNGSDFTAAILGAAGQAREIQIWSDVEGVMTADPDLIPGARPIRAMSFAEAGELAYYGGRIHPSTLVPAVLHRIPVRMLCTFKPDAPGTLILHEAPRGETVKSIVYKRRIFLINLRSTRMLRTHGFMARVFETLGRHKVVIDMIATSEVSVSLTTDEDRNLEASVRELSRFAEVTVEDGLAILCVVGDGIREAAGVPALVFDALRREDVPVRMISYGAARINIACLVPGADVDRSVRALHDLFFGRDAPPEPAATPLRGGIHGPV